jgi:hypothetical protein
VLDQIARTGKLEDIKVNGDNATFNFIATFQKKPYRIKQRARKIDGEWKLVDTAS